MRIVEELQKDPTREELQNAPENSYEAEANFYTPSSRYRNILTILDKDITLAKLGQLERKELILISRILLNSITLEDKKGWKDENGEPNRELSNYWIQRAALCVTSTRAIDGFTAELSRSQIKRETLATDQRITENKPAGGAFNVFKPKEAGK